MARSRKAEGRGGERPAQGVGGGARARVLLVEDDADSRELLSELLGFRFEVSAASSVEEALRSAEKKCPDAVVADVFLPGKDGLALLEALQQAPETAEVPVLFLSARAEERLVVDCLERGAADFIAKPPPCRELIARVERALKEGRHRAELEALARTDVLTGLSNVRSLGVKLEEEIQRATRYHHPVSVVMMDLDHFKELNDRFGHTVGSQALAAVGRLLAADLRQADFAARYGGDEFVVLLPHQAPADAERFAERVRLHLSALQLTDERGGVIDARLAASFGIAGLSGPLGRKDGEALLRAADLALYEAKRRGRNQVALFGREVAAEAERLHPPV